MFSISQRHFVRSISTMIARRSARLSAGSIVEATANATVIANVTGNVQSNKRKATSDVKIDVDGFTVPTTPKKKKAVKSEPPSTPTPQEAKAMAVPYSSGDVDAISAPVPRLANPRFTNAPLISPQTSRLVANSPLDQTSPSKIAKITSTTEHILDKALEHLIAVDSRLQPIIEKHHCHAFSPAGLSEEIDPFQSLASGIISQQVSGAAAKSIKAKFVALFNEDVPEGTAHMFPTPAQVVEKDIPTLRSAGLSQRKAEYITGLAEKFANGELSTEMLLRAEYDEVLEKLIAVRGLGKWSVEMFACFGLKRMDVFSTGDLGVQRGMAALIGKDVGKLKAKGGGKWKYMSENDMIEMAEKFSPYRSVFMWYMWRVEDVDISTFE